MKEKNKGLWKIVKGVGGLFIGGLVIMAFLGVFDDETEESGNKDVLRGNDTKSFFDDGRSQNEENENGKDVGQTAEIKESEDDITV